MPAVDAGSTWSDLQGANSTSLTTGTLTPSENGWRVRAVFTNHVGSATTNNAEITVAPTISVALPANGATVSAGQWLDASASSGVTQVVYQLTGGTLDHTVIATATPTIVGWLAGFDTTTIPNGSYTLQGVATYPGGSTGASAGVTITVNNPPPTATIGLPANGATVSAGQWLDASASSGVTQVVYQLTGGTLDHTVIATATPTIVGWLADWNTTTVPNGSYALQSLVSYAGGVTGTSSSIAVTVAN